MPDPNDMQCRDCSECTGVPHHAMPPDEDDDGKWYVGCKHCDVRGWYCGTCNEDDCGDIDPKCPTCRGLGVVWSDAVVSDGELAAVKTLRKRKGWGD